MPLFVLVFILMAPSILFTVWRRVFTSCSCLKHKYSSWAPNMMTVLWKSLWWNVKCLLSTWTHTNDSLTVWKDVRRVWPTVTLFLWQYSIQNYGHCLAWASGAVAPKIFYSALDNSPLWVICQSLTKEHGSVVISWIIILQWTEQTQNERGRTG